MRRKHARLLPARGDRPAWNCLVMVLILMGLLSALAAGYSTLMRADTVLRAAAGRERQGFYAAEAGLNFSMAEVRDDFKNYTPPAAYSHSIDVGSGAHA